MINPHSAASFAQFFDNKVADIKAKAANDQPPTIVSRDYVPPLATFRQTSSEVATFIRKTTSKHCELDPVPTWLAKHLAPVNSTNGESIVSNDSLEEAVFPEAGKVAIVKPIIKQSNLDPFDLKSWRPI